MDTSEFYQVYKNKVGYRLREVLSGKSTAIKEKNSDGNWVSIKAYEFNMEKIQRVAKKYDYEFSTKLLSVPSSESVNATQSMEKDDKKNDENKTDRPLQLSTLSNSVEKTIQETAMLQCSFCKEKGKTMFFATEQDLKLHTQVFHGYNSDYVR
jgi:protein-disulfide isomerase